MAADSGFLMPEGTVTIQFEGSRFEGARVRCVAAPTLEIYLKIEELQKRGADGDSKEQLRLFGEHGLLSWNLRQRVLDENGDPVLDEDGSERTEPVPATAEALLKGRGDFGILLVNKWMEHIKVQGQISGNSDAPSSSGNTPAAPNTRKRAR